MTALIEEIAPAPFICKPMGFAVLAISGTDRESFLQAQFINDLTPIKKTGVQFSAWCNPKGQVIANFLLLNTGTRYLLFLQADLKLFVQKRLGLFVLRSDVTIESIPEQQLLLLGFSEQTTLPSALELTLPTKNEVISIDDLVITSLPYSATNRYLLIADRNMPETTLLEKNISSQMTDSMIWSLRDLFDGIPWITATTQEQFLPQTLNLDRLNGLSYQKGCYPGQEIIARLHYRGTVKKNLYLIKSKHLLAVGGLLISEQSDSDLGSIINVASHLDGYYYALAVIKIENCHDKLRYNDQNIMLVTQANND